MTTKKIPNEHEIYWNFKRSVLKLFLFQTHLWMLKKIKNAISKMIPMCAGNIKETLFLIIFFFSSNISYSNYSITILALDMQKRERKKGRKERNYSLECLTFFSFFLLTSVGNFISFIISFFPCSFCRQQKEEWIRKKKKCVFLFIQTLKTYLCSQKHVFFVV